MKVQKVKETYRLTCKDPVNNKENKVLVHISFPEKSFDMLRIRVSENSDIVDRAILFAETILATTNIQEFNIDKPIIVK
jgi:hypothetical protein